MKQLTLRFLPLWSAAILPVVSVLGLSLPAFAGTITVTDTTPNAVVTGALVENTEAFTVTQPASDRLKLFGTGTFTNNGSNTGDGTLRIPLSGTFTAAPNDRLFANYEFTLTRGGSTTGTVSYSVTGTGTASVLGVPVTLSASSSGTVVPGTQTYFGSSQSSANTTPFTLSGTYTAYLEITWTDGTAGDTLAINIPNNSIDFVVSTVPEPASLGLLGIGGLAMVRRRRV